MFEGAELLGFVAAGLTLVLIPGPNTMIILAQSLSGRASGLATVAGVEVGTVAHTLAAAAGLSALVATPVGFNLVRLMGIAYLLFIGVRSFLSETPRLSTALEPAGAGAAFRRALITNLLNPKSALFFLAFLPHFLHPERGRVFLQTVILGAIVSIVGLCFGLLLVAGAGVLSERLRRHASFGRWQQRITGTVFIALAVGLARTSR